MAVVVVFVARDSQIVVGLVLHSLVTAIEPVAVVVAAVAVPDAAATIPRAIPASSHLTVDSAVRCSLQWT